MRQSGAGRRFGVLLLVLASALTQLPGDAAGTASVSARTLLSRLTVAGEAGTPTYRAGAFGTSALDADGDGCGTRAEVLLAESLVPPSRAATPCRVTSGRWRSAYDGELTTRPRSLVVDPLVGRLEAWQSGARSWARTTRVRFVNDLGLPATLGAVTSESADRRGARDPGRWLPTTRVCDYAVRWVSVKYRWSLSVDELERSRLAALLVGDCGARSVPVRRLSLLAKPTAKPKPTPSPTPTSTTTSGTGTASPTASTASPVAPSPTASGTAVPTTSTATAGPTATATPTATPTPTPTASITPATPTPTTSAPPAAAVTGTVRTASGTALAGILVAVEDPSSGAVLTRSTTDGSGNFSLAAVPGTVRLVVAAGDAATGAAGLPDTFRWSGETSLTVGQVLPVTLPVTRTVTVAATDAVGNPLVAAGVTAPETKPTSPVILWPGGPVMTGTQQAAGRLLATGPDGRAEIRAFATYDLGSVVVEHSPAPGTSQRTSMGSLAVQEPVLVVAVPSRSACTPRAVPDLAGLPVTLVADLDQLTPRAGSSRSALLQTADRIVSGSIPAVAYNSARTGDALRYLYDEGVALRRVTGILAYAYAATRDPGYLDAMARKVAVNAAGWPDWNPGHPLDNAQVATAVSLAYRWSARRMTSAEKATVTAALTTRMLMAYSCADGALAAKRTTTGNQNTVIATAATLSGLALRADGSAWASVGTSDGTGALARFREPTGSGRSLAEGPTVEGLMYTTYEAANLALLHATRWRNAGDAAVAALLDRSLADLGVLATWSERCGTVADPDIEDGWDYYPWVDRPTALAAMVAWPGAGGHVMDLVDGLQARDTLTIPGRGTWSVPDGVAELILSSLPAATGQPPAVHAYVPAQGSPAAYLGCAADGPVHALLSSTPNDEAHAHRDVGNLVVFDGDQTLLADLGQRDYNFSAPYVWRPLTKAHNVVGVLQPDGRVLQAGTGSGVLSSTSDGLRMVAGKTVYDALWTRDVSLTGSSVTVRDQLSATTVLTAPKPISTTFLLQVPPSRVADLGQGRLRITLANGSTWQMQVPPGVRMTVGDGSPTAPYEDTTDFLTTLAPAHTLVQLTADLMSTLDLTTTLTRTAP